MILVLVEYCGKMWQMVCFNGHFMSFCHVFVLYCDPIGSALGRFVVSGYIPPWNRKPIATLNLSQGIPLLRSPKSSIISYRL